MKQLIKLEIVYFLVWGFTLLPLSAMRRTSDIKHLPFHLPVNRRNIVRRRNARRNFFIKKFGRDSRIRTVRKHISGSRRIVSGIRRQSHSHRRREKQQSIGHRTVIKPRNTSGMDHRDNLDHTKREQTSRWVVAGNLNIVPNEQWNVSVAYSGFQSYTNIRSQFDYINATHQYERDGSFRPFYQPLPEN